MLIHHIPFQSHLVINVTLFLRLLYINTEIVKKIEKNNTQVSIVQGLFLSKNTIKKCLVEFEYMRKAIGTELELRKRINNRLF